MRYFSQLGEDCLLAQFFGFKVQGHFVDVGAFDGVYLSNTYAFELLGWTGACIEAAPEYYELCVENRPRSVCHHAACLAADEGSVELLAESGGLFSGVQVDPNHVAGIYRNYGVPFDGFYKVSVPSRTLNTLLGDPVSDIDFVSIDVEGAELQVLQGFDLRRYEPRILVIEANSDTARHALEDYLSVHGYALARSMYWNHFFVRSEEDSQSLQSITVSTTIERPAHPLGRAYNRVGEPLGPTVYWPAATRP
jgi:FkbM family methyltransferase